MLHFGVREHAMGSIMNGIKVHGGLRPYGGTFLIFSDYMRPAVRLAALMELPVIYVWTRFDRPRRRWPHHQPIEHLAALRAIPGLDVVRPADANEDRSRMGGDLEEQGPPGGAGPHPSRPCSTRAAMTASPTSQVAKGGYILQRLRRNPRCDLDRDRLGGAVRC